MNKDKWMEKLKDPKFVELVSNRLEEMSSSDQLEGKMFELISRLTVTEIAELLAYALYNRALREKE